MGVGVGVGVGASSGTGTGIGTDTGVGIADFVGGRLHFGLKIMFIPPPPFQKQYFFSSRDNFSTPIMPFLL